MGRSHVDFERSLVGPSFEGQKAAGLRLNLKQDINLASRFGSRFFCERNQQRAKLVRASRLGYYLRDHKIAGLPAASADEAARTLVSRLTRAAVCTNVRRSQADMAVPSCCWQS